MAAQTTVFATDRFNRLYTPEEQAHFSRSKAIAKYLERKATASPGSAQTVDDTWIADNDLHITAPTAAITIAGNPVDADMMYCRSPETRARTRSQ